MSLKSQGKIPHKSAIRAHTCVRARAINQCRLMTVLMGKCTGFPQGHQGPEHFNWQDQILLPFPSSSPPSPARDNAVCILIHHRVSHSASQSLSRQLGGMDVRRWGAVVVGGRSQQFLFFFPMFCENIIDSINCCFLHFKLMIENKVNFLFEKH